MASERHQSESDKAMPPREATPAVFNRAEAAAAVLLLVGVAITGVVLARASSAEREPTVVMRGDGVPAYRVTADINHDSWERLTLVPGVGVKTAHAIVADREANGPFAGVDELARVKGIGPKSIDGWRPYLTARWPAGVDTSDANDNAVNGGSTNATQTSTAGDAGAIAADLRAAAAARGLTYPIDVNAADAKTLDLLVPGIGPTLAARIVAAREADGRYASMAELSTRVRGVSARMATDWQRYLTCNSDE